jgi:dethiobiotin synthetase
VTARAVFVTGTDTGVGKTVVACALTRGLVAQGFRVAVMKPVASGATRTALGLRSEDALALLSASNVQAPYELVNPYCFEPPVSPHIAAEDANIDIDADLIARDLDRLKETSDFVVVEGAGGWLAPVSRTQSMGDLARCLRASVLMVVGLRLGCLSHARLTRQGIATHGVPFVGWIANEVDPQLLRADENLAALEEFLGEAPLARVPFVASGAFALTLTEAARAVAHRA